MVEVLQSIEELQPLLEASNVAVRKKLEEIVHEFSPTPGTGTFEGQGAKESSDAASRSMAQK